MNTFQVNQISVNSSVSTLLFSLCLFSLNQHHTKWSSSLAIVLLSYSFSHYYISTCTNHRSKRTHAYTPIPVDTLRVLRFALIHFTLKTKHRSLHVEHCDRFTHSAYVYLTEFIAGEVKQTSELHIANQANKDLFARRLVKYTGLFPIVLCKTLRLLFYPIEYFLGHVPMDIMYIYCI